MIHRCLARPALVLGLSLVLVTHWTPAADAGGLPGKWLEVRTPHFIVISNARKRQAQETAQHFEQIRQLFGQSQPRLATESTQPLKVLAASDERTMKRLLPSAWESRSRSRPAGVFRHTPTTTQIVVRADLVGGENFRLVYHEYYHYLVDHSRRSLPVWINEGLAEFWGNSRLTPRGAEIGRPSERHLGLLRNRNLLPLPLVTTVDHSSPYYRDGDKKPLLYAQSWALTHYLVLGDKSGGRRQQLFDYLRRLAEGETPEAAAVRAFGDLEELETELEKYVRKLLFHYAELPAPAPLPDEQLRVRALTDAEAAAHVARFLVESERRENPEELLALAIEEAPELAETHEAAGILRVSQGDYEEAAGAFGRALERDLTRALPHYGLAVIRFHRDRSAESLEVIAQRLQQAVALDPDFAPALARLAEVYRRTGAGDQALGAIRRAVAIEPDFALYRLKEAQILLESDQGEAASAAAGDVAGQAAATDNGARNNSVCWTGSLWGLAKDVLPACERAVELDPERGGVLDSRGVARALAGDLDGALSDLRRARELAADRWSEEQKAKRDAWIRSLESGVSPFAGEGLEELREDPEEAGVGWWL